MAKDSTIKPVGEYILVEAIEEEETTASGLILQTSGKGERPQKGKIIALGSGKKDDKGTIIPFSLEVGETVLFKKYSPEEIELNGKKYLLMKESDVLGVLVG